MEELYNKDLEKLLTNYKFLENLDYDIFKELNINIKNLKEALKQKISGLKNLYWNELFDNLNKITEKLTAKSRKKLLDTLTRNTNIDFTKKNVYAIIIWVLKNANKYIDEQLKDVYFEMADKENIKNYKSNTHFVEDSWRFTAKEHSHFSLDYRLVFKRHRCFNYDSYGMYDYPNNLYIDVHRFLNDICTIANNLGFQNIDRSFDFEWKPGKEETFRYQDEEFMKVRAYKNGNIHCKINQEFMKKFNIEMARLNKWVKDEVECSKELEIDKEEVHKYWKTNKKLLINDIKLLTF